MFDTTNVYCFCHDNNLVTSSDMNLTLYPWTNVNARPCGQMFKNKKMFIWLGFPSPQNKPGDGWGISMSWSCFSTLELSLKVIINAHATLSHVQEHITL